MKRFLLFLTITLFLLTSCAAAKKPLEDEILGTWANPEGYTIQFLSGGKGFIPGVEGKIADSDFTYTIADDSHIQIAFQGRNLPIEIIISGDELIWKDSLGEVKYTRVK